MPGASLAIHRHGEPLTVARRPLLFILATAVVVWSTGYALAHVYWALGGDIGLGLLKPGIEDLDYFRLINAVASPILLVPALLAVAVVRLPATSRLRALALIGILAGAAITTSHGLYGMAYRLAQVAGVLDIDGRPFDLSAHDWVLWDLFLFEPWFLIEGLLLSATGWAAFSTPRARRRWLLAVAALTALATLTGVLGLRFA